MTTMLLGLISCEDQAEAEAIGTHLLKKRLAACAQIINAVDSSFLWPPGKAYINTSKEVLLLVKTLESKWDELEKEVIKVHSYKNPEIIAVSVTHVTKKYLDWLTKELS